MRRPRRNSAGVAALLLLLLAGCNTFAAANALPADWWEGLDSLLYAVLQDVLQLLPLFA
jgi:hypothetical protein